MRNVESFGEKDQRKWQKTLTRYLFIFHFVYCSHLTGLPFSFWLCVLLCLLGSNHNYPLGALGKNQNKKSAYAVWCTLCLQSIKEMLASSQQKLFPWHTRTDESRCRNRQNVFLSVSSYSQPPYQKHPPTIYKIVTHIGRGEPVFNNLFVDIYLSLFHSTKSII